MHPFPWKTHIFINSPCSLVLDRHLNFVFANFEGDSNLVEGSRFTWSLPLFFRAYDVMMQCRTSLITHLWSMCVGEHVE